MEITTITTFTLTLGNLHYFKYNLIAQFIFFHNQNAILKSLPFKVGLFLRTNFSKSSKSIGKSAQYLYFNVQTNLPLSITSKINVFIDYLLPLAVNHQYRATELYLRFQNKKPNPSKHNYYLTSLMMHNL